MASIMSRQLSTKVAKVILERFLALYDGEEPTPKQALDSPFDTLRGIGLTNARVHYVQNAARFCIDKKVTGNDLKKMSDEAIIALLTQIKGVGQWTVEMLLMFLLGREDIFAKDDLGIMPGMVKAFKQKIENKKTYRKNTCNIG